VGINRKIEVPPEGGANQEIAKMRRTRLSGLAKAIVGAFVMAGTLCAGSFTVHAEDGEDRWPALRKEFFGDRPIVDEKAPLAIEAPDKAEDSAVVPMTVYLFPSVAEDVTTLHVFIENNPMPLVGKFNFGSGAGTGARTLSTRVRFDTFSYIRAVAETKDGRLLMTTKFVQAAGGCSAPAVKDFQEAMEHTGEMRLKKIEKQHRFLSNQQSAMITREAEVMLRHPNYSGMQMDKETGAFIPARYVRQIDVKRGDDLVFHLEAGISLSTNPNIRFTYGSLTDESLSATASDSDGKEFSAKAPTGGS
jgi:sulfur-oxidizing protein SoxY